MKVYVSVPHGLSLAMSRVAQALAVTAPEGVSIVRNEDDADLVVLHVIGQEALTYRPDKQVAVLQYCFVSAGGSLEQWQQLWSRAAVTWSYYDLRAVMPQDAAFYHAPLGIGDHFREDYDEQPRRYGILTSGYVTGPIAEAIEEATLASERAGYPAVHLCRARPVGADPRTHFRLTGALSDEALAQVYRQCRYVSGLRHVEGFELPALEGLACGARPIMFSRPNDAHWFGPHGAVFVPECHGKELEDILTDVLRRDPQPVSREERECVLARFDWWKLAAGFWNIVTERVNA